MDSSHEAPMSVEFSRQKYRRGLSFPTSGDLPDPGTEPMSPASLALANSFFTTVPPKQVTCLGVATEGRLSTKSKSSFFPGLTGKFGLGVQNESGQRLIEFCQENALCLPTTQEKTLHMDITRWSTPKSD